MRRTLSLFLAIILCLVMCACGKKPEDQEQLETVSVTTLFENLDNGARAQLNVGKGTTIYGKINIIASSCCSVQLIKPAGGFVMVEMPIEELAQLKPDEFIAIYGEVISYNFSNWGKYTIKALEKLDFAAMDAYIRSEFETDLSKSANLIEENYRIDVLADYLEFRGAEFELQTDAELGSYLIGKWSRIPGDYKETIEFKSDKTYTWHFRYEDYGGKEYERDQNGDWSISDVELVCEIAGYSGEPVFVLTENAFVWSDRVHIRK